MLVITLGAALPLVMAGYGAGAPCGYAAGGGIARPVRQGALALFG